MKSGQSGSGQPEDPRDLHDLIENEYFARRNSSEPDTDRIDEAFKTGKENTVELESIEEQYFGRLHRVEVEPPSAQVTHGPASDHAEKKDPDHVSVPKVPPTSSPERQPGDRVSLKPLKQLWGSIPDVSEMKRDELIDFLATRCLVEEQEDLVVLSKPYGLVTKGGYRQHRSLFGLLPHLANRLGTDQLYPLNRLDRQVTGCLPLAKGRDAYARLVDQQREYGFEKEYLCIVRGIPRCHEGTIDLPLAQLKSGSGRFRVFPTVKHGAASIRAKRAETDYCVLSANNHTALVRTRINKGQKHQVRCHLGFVLNTPVVGDHKYSDPIAMKQQVLATSTLKALGLPRHAAHNLPMFMHASRICLPKIDSGDLRIFEAKLPKHFMWLMQKLKLTLLGGVLLLWIFLSLVRVLCCHERNEFSGWRGGEKLLVMSVCLSVCPSKATSRGNDATDSLAVFTDG